MSVSESHISLAKSILQGTLSRPEQGLNPIAKDDFAAFSTGLELTLRSSHAESQFSDCALWIFVNIVPSTSRTSAFAKYLVKLSRSLVNDPILPTQPRPQKRDPRVDHGAPLPAWYPRTELFLDGQVLAARLQLLCILDAVLHLTHRNGQTGFSQAMLAALDDITSAALPRQGRHALECFRLVQALLRSWRQSALIESMDAASLRRTINDAYQEWLGWLVRSDYSAHKLLTRRVKIDNSVPRMPQLHGDPNAPWHDLPAGVMLSMIKSRQPLNTAMMRPLKLAQGPVDPELLDAVRAHITSCDSIYAVPKRPLHDQHRVKLDGLGLRLSRDPRTGKLEPAESYYGFSPCFVERLKKRKREQVVPPQALPPFDQRGPPTMVEPPALPRPVHSMNQSLSFVPPPSTMPFPPRPPAWQGPWPPPPPPFLFGQAPSAVAAGPPNPYGRSQDEPYPNRDSRGDYQAGDYDRSTAHRR